LKNGRICKKHFKPGQPAHFDDRENEDWVPNMNMGYEPAIDPIRVEKNTNRKERLKQRNVVKAKLPRIFCRTSKSGLSSFFGRISVGPRLKKPSTTNKGTANRQYLNRTWSSKQKCTITILKRKSFTIVVTVERNFIIDNTT
jgi:hypothetical protein